MTDKIPPGYEAYEPTWRKTPVFMTVVGAVGALTVLIWTIATLYLGLIDLRFGVSVGGVVLATVVLHECVHAVAGWVVGCQITAGIDNERWNTIAYVVTSGTCKTRRETLAITLAPLVVLDLFAIGVIVGTGPLSIPGLFAITGLCTNTFGSIVSSGSDIVAANKLWQLQSSAKIRDNQDQSRTYIRPQHSNERYHDHHNTP